MSLLEDLRWGIAHRAHQFAAAQAAGDHQHEHTHATALSHQRARLADLEADLDQITVNATTLGRHAIRNGARPHQTTIRTQEP